MDIVTVLWALVASVIYAGSFYLKNRETAGEGFDAAKFLATLLVGLIVGVVSGITNSPLTEQTVWEQLMAYAGLVVFLETWIKTLVRGWKEGSAGG